MRGGRPQRVGMACRGEWPNPPTAVAAQAGEEARSHQPAWGLASPSASLLLKRPENEPLPRTEGDYTAKSMRTPEDAKSRESVTCGPAGGLDLTLALSIVSILCRSEAPGALSLGPCRNRKQTQKFQSLQNSMACNESLATIRDR